MHQSPPEGLWDCRAHPVSDWVGLVGYVLLLVVEGPQHPCSAHLPFSSSCLLTSGRCQDCFPWSTSLGSASFFNTVVEELLFQKLGNFSKCLSYLFAVAGKVLLLAISLSGWLRTLQSTLFGESFIFLASFRCCCFQAFDICLFGDLNGVWKHPWAIKAEPTDPLTSLCAISWWGRNPSWLLPPSVTLLAGTTGAGDKETWTSKTAQALTKEAADTRASSFYHPSCHPANRDGSCKLCPRPDHIHSPSSKPFCSHAGSEKVHQT